MRPRSLEHNTQNAQVSTGYHTQARMVSSRMKTQSADASTEVTEALDLTAVYKEAIIKMEDMISTNLR